MSAPAAHRTAAVLGGLIGCVVAATGQPTWAALAILLDVAVGVVCVDLRERRIPTPLVVIGAIAATIVALITSLVDVTSTPIVHLVGGAALIGGAFLLVHLMQPRGLGFGDVRLAALVGAIVWYGTGSVSATVATAVLAAVAVVVTTFISRSPSVPFAPYLLGVALITLAAAAIG